VPPGSDVVPGRIEKRAEPHLTFRAHWLRHLLLRGVPGPICCDYSTLNTLFSILGPLACPRRSAMVNRRAK
jgi:hypothetical protein